MKYRFRAPIALSLLLCLAGSAVAATVPRPSPEFVIRGAGGEALLSSYRGKVVLLAFILTTCPHCQHSVGIMNEIQKEYGPKGFQALATAFNELAPQLLPDFLTRFRPAFPVGYTSRASVYDYLQFPANMPFSVPMMVFIDRKGVIRAQHLGDDPFFENQDKNIRSMIDSLLKEPASAKKAAKK